MKIVIVDDQDLQFCPKGNEEVKIETIEVSWDKGTHSSVSEVADQILASEPDVVFLDHTLGFSHAKIRGTGEDIAHVLREKGFKGRLVSSSSAPQSYCESFSGKVSFMKLGEFLQYATGELVVNQVALAKHEEMEKRCGGRK